jgi:hypothetical protein
MLFFFFWARSSPTMLVGLCSCSLALHRTANRRRLLALCRPAGERAQLRACQPATTMRCRPALKMAGDRCAHMDKDLWEKFGLDAHVMCGFGVVSTRRPPVERFGIGIGSDQTARGQQILTGLFHTKHTLLILVKLALDLIGPDQFSFSS